MTVLLILLLLLCLFRHPLLPLGLDVFSLLGCGEIELSLYFTLQVKEFEEKPFDIRFC